MATVVENLGDGEMAGDPAVESAMLRATQKAAEAALSAADAAWWALAINMLAAVGTVGALAWAIFLARSDARARRSREDVLVMAAASMLNASTAPLRAYKRKVEVEGRLDFAHMARVAQKTWEESRVIERIEDFDIHSLPNIASYDAFEVARLEIRHALIDLKQAEKSEALVEDYNEHITIIERSVEELKVVARIK